MRSAAVAFLASLLALGCASKQPAPTEAPKPVAETPAPAPKPVAPTAPEVKAPAPAPVPVPAPTPAAEAPKADRVAALIEQLGSADYDKREEATKALAAMGKEVAPALEKAAKDADVERASRAKDLLLVMGASEEDAKSPDIAGLAAALRANQGGPKVMVGGAGGVVVGVQAVAVAGGGGGAGGNLRTSTEMSEGVIKRTLENDNGSAVVSEGKDGFSLTLTPKGGEAKTYSAASREEFKKKYPKTYAKYFGN